MAKRSPRAGARREMLWRLKEIKSTIVTLQAWWTTYGTMYDSEKRVFVERPLSEYPEAQASYWASTYNNLDELLHEIVLARDFAYREYQETINQEKS